METTKFKTNIKCAGCVEKVTPFLNEAVGVENWKVDYTDPAKVLTVEGEDTKEKVVKALERAGYKAELLNN